jgi:hypothetical protein
MTAWPSASPRSARSDWRTPLTSDVTCPQHVREQRRALKVEDESMRQQTNCEISEWLRRRRGHAIASPAAGSSPTGCVGGVTSC